MAAGEPPERPNSTQIASPSQQLQFALLGPPEVRWGKQIVHFRTRKSLALLVYLAMTRTTQPRERLAAFLWPDSDDPHARALLRRTLAYLKDALPPPSHTLVSAVHDTLGREALRFDAESTMGGWDGTGHTPTVEVRFDTDLIERAARRAAQLPALDSLSARGEEDEAALVETLIQAAQCYRGPFLDGLRLDDTPRWEEWVQQQRAFWQRQIAMVFDRLVHVELDTGRLDGALAHAQRWSELLPFDEMAQLALMQALAACDDRPGALTAFSLFRKRLAAELELEPSAALVAFAEQLRLHERSAPAKTPAVHRTLTPDSIASLQMARPEMPFAGRETEFTALVGATTRAMQERRQQVVIVQGEAGIGKTRLLEEFLRWAEAQGADVIRAQALETGGRLPYQPLVDVLRPLLARANAPEDLVDDVWLAELARLFPELRERYPDLPPPGVEDSTAQHRLFDAVANLVLALAHRAIRASPPAASRDPATLAPLVRVFDDLHWADAGTRELLRHLLRRFQEERLPLLIVLALRSGWQGSAIEPDELLRDLGRRHDVTALLLEPLSEAAVVSGLGRMLQDESGSLLARWLYAETTGQPLYLQQMLQMLFERGLLQWTHQPLEAPQSPEPHFELTPTARLELMADAAELDRLRGQLPVSVRAVLIERLQRLSPPARRLLGAAAVIGSRFDFEQAAEVAQLAEADALDALEEAERLLLVRSVTDASGAIARALYQFTHDKLREVSYTEIGEARRRTLSRRALAVLEAGGKASAAELERYALAGGMSEAAFHFSILAGDEALTIFAVQDAVAHYELARTLLTESTNQAAGTPSKGRQFAADECARLHLQLGRAYEWQGDWDRARELYYALRQLAHLASDRTLEAKALTRLALVAREQSWDLPTAQALVSEALDLVELGGDTGVLAETLWTLAAIRAQCGDLDAARAAIDRSLELARKGKMEELIARGHVVLWQIHTFVGDWDETVVAAREARERYRALADELRGRYAEPPRHRSEEASARLLWSGAPPPNVAAYRSMEAVGLIGVCIGEINRGDPQAGIQAGREALRLLEEATNAQVTALGCLCLAHGLTEVGSYEEALAVARRGLEAAQISGDLYSMVATRCALAHALQAVGSIEEAAALLRDALAVAERIPVTYWSLRPLAYLCANRAVADDWSIAGDIVFRAIATRGAAHSQVVYFDFVRHYEIEALLRCGAVDEARREVEGLGERLSEADQDRRFRLTHLRMCAALSRWEGNPTAEIGKLEAARALAVEMNLPGERWQIAAQLGAVYRSLGDDVKSEAALEEAHIIIHILVARINDPALRQAFLHATPYAAEMPF